MGGGAESIVGIPDALPAFPLFVEPPASPPGAGLPCFRRKLEAVLEPASVQTKPIKSL